MVNSRVNPNPPPFALCVLPGKGVSVIATARIPAGTVLFREPPLLLLHHAGPKRSLLLASFADTSPLVRTAYLSLCNGSPDGKPYDDDEANVLGVWKVNNFCLDDQGLTNAVFALSSRLNHACTGGENCRWDWDEEKKLMTFSTDQNVEEGEELTHCYRPDWRMGTAKRREAILEAYGFLCMCRVCLEPEEG